MEELPTTLEEDEACAAVGEDAEVDEAATRWWMALRFRLGAKRLLASFARDCRELAGE